MKKEKKLLIRILFTLALIAVIYGQAFCKGEEKSDHSEWLSKMVDYGIESYIPPEKFKWDWSQATFMKGLVQYNDHEQGGDSEKILEYVEECLVKAKDVESGIHPNVVSMGHLLAYMARKTGEDEYKNRAFEIYEQYKNIIRAENGGVSHRHNVVELWDDTVYMLGLFFFEMYRLTGDEVFLDEFVEQLVAHHEKLVDNENGLWVHAWDADTIPFDDGCSQLGWANKRTQRNHEHWGRGNGWVVMACADALNLIPQGTQNFNTVKSIFKQLCSHLVPLQDPETGHWYQLPNYPDEEGNWIESSATAMFAYGMIRGVEAGVLSRSKYNPVIKNAYSGLVNHSIKGLNGGYATPTNVCAGTCPGDKEHYYNRKIVEGKPFGLGAFIMLGVQYNRFN